MPGQIKFAPMRELDDFIGKAHYYAVPDTRDMLRLYNRITNNLLYYQTNYFLVLFSIFTFISMIDLLHLLTSLVTFVAIASFLIKLINKGDQAQHSKFALKILCINSLSGFVFKMMGLLLMFTGAIFFPVCLIVLHAALRKRNFKNKIVNKIESIGLTHTCMGFLLEKLDVALEDALNDEQSKSHLNAKLKLMNTDEARGSDASVKSIFKF